MDMLTTKCDVLVTYVKATDSVGDDGRPIRGCSVIYNFWGDNGFAFNPVSEPDPTVAIGLRPGKAWIDLSMRDKVRIAPAIYEGTFKMDVDKDLKPTLKLVDLAYKSHVEFKPRTIEGLYVPGMIEGAAAPAPEEVPTDSPANLSQQDAPKDAKSRK